MKPDEKTEPAGKTKRTYKRRIKKVRRKKAVKVVSSKNELATLRNFLKRKIKAYTAALEALK